MAGHTPRFGLNTFGPGQQGTIGDEGQKYTGADRLLLDRLLAQTETHDHRLRPATGPVLAAPALMQHTSGALQAGQQIFYRYAIVQADGTETLASPVAITILPAMLPVPVMPTLSVDPADVGTLAPGYYMYALTALRGGEETPVGPVATITVIAGEGAVTVTLPPLGAADSYRVWRMGLNDPGFTKLGVSSGVEFIDSGSVSADPCAGDFGNAPPVRNTGVAVYSVAVALPGDVDLSTAQGWRLYRSGASVFGSASLVHYVVERTDQVNPTAPLLASWEDVGDPLVSGAPMDADLNMRFSPFVLDAVAALPDAAGYPDHYPLVFDGALYWKDGGEWVQLAGAGGGGSEVVGPAPRWRVYHFETVPLGAVTAWPDNLFGFGASATITCVSDDVPIGRTRAIEFTPASPLNSTVDLTIPEGWSSRSENVSVRFLYKMVGSDLTATLLRASTVKGSLAATTDWQWSPWISLGGKYVMNPVHTLRLTRATVGTTQPLFLAAIEFMDTALVGAQVPTDGFVANVPNNGTYRFDYLGKRWVKTASHMGESVAIVTRDYNSAYVTPAVPVAKGLNFFRSDIRRTSGLDDESVFLSVGAANSMVRFAPGNYRVLFSAAVEGLTKGDRITMTQALVEGPVVAVVPASGSSEKISLSFEISSNVTELSMPSLAVDPVGAPGTYAISSYGLSVIALDRFTPYSMDSAAVPALGGLAATQPTVGVGSVKVTWDPALSSAVAGDLIDLCLIDVVTNTIVAENDSVDPTTGSYTFPGVALGTNLYAATWDGQPDTSAFLYVH